MPHCNMGSEPSLRNNTFSGPYIHRQHGRDWFKPRRGTPANKIQLCTQMASTEGTRARTEQTNIIYPLTRRQSGPHSHVTSFACDLHRNNLKPQTPMAYGPGPPRHDQCCCLSGPTVAQGMVRGSPGEAPLSDCPRPRLHRLRRTHERSLARTGNQRDQAVRGKSPGWRG